MGKRKKQMPNILTKYIDHMDGKDCKPTSLCPRCGIRRLPPNTGGYVTSYVPRITLQTISGPVRYQMRVCTSCNKKERWERDELGLKYDGDLDNWAVMAWGKTSSAPLSEYVGIFKR